MKKIAFGADHAGYQMKNELLAFCEKNGYVCENFGTDSPDSVDYPDYAKKVCFAVAEGRADCGILVCGTGVGMSMAANKQKKIRAALCSEPVSAALTRSHNDANVLCLGARIIGQTAAEEIVRTFLETDFSGGERHLRRIAKIES